MIINIQVKIYLEHHSDSTTKSITVERTYPEFLYTHTERTRITKELIMQLLHTEFDYTHYPEWCIMKMDCTNWECKIR